MFRRLGLLGFVAGVSCTSAAPPQNDAEAHTPDAPPAAPSDAVDADAKPDEAADNGAAEAGADPAEADTRGASSLFYSDEELRGLGLRVVRTSDRRALVCPPGDDVYCECIEALDCGGGDCIALDDNLEVFREALARKTGATVHCESAQTGTCDGASGPLSYFDFNGDIHRYELRFFAETDGVSRLVAMRNSTDYNEYCDGKAMTRWLGGIPKCDAMSQQERLCGEAKSPPASPVRRLEILGSR